LSQEDGGLGLHPACAHLTTAHSKTFSVMLQHDSYVDSIFGFPQSKHTFW
jgi:hypothetical protein